MHDRIFAIVVVLLVDVASVGVLPAQDHTGLNALLQLLEESSEDAFRADLLSGMLQGLAGRRSVEMPSRWPAAYAKLQESSDDGVLDRALEIALIFDDPVALGTLRRRATSTTASAAARNRAIQRLVAKKQTGLAPLLLRLVADPITRNSAVRGLAEYDHPETASRLLKLYPSFDPTARQDAILTLASRPAWATPLLEAVAAKRISRSDLTAYTARQLQSLGKKQITAQVHALWGEVRTTPAEKLKLIGVYKRRLTPESLKSGSRSAGRGIYQQACASCHRLFDSGGTIGPEITGSQRTNLDYLLENLLDPSATVAKDYQMQVIATATGRVVTGLVVSENEKRVTVQTVNEKLVVPTDEIEIREQSSVSMMPEGMLQKLTTRQVRDLIAYLAGSQQVPLPEPAPVEDR